MQMPHLLVQTSSPVVSQYQTKVPLSVTCTMPVHCPRVRSSNRAGVLIASDHVWKDLTSISETQGIYGTAQGSQ